MGWCENGAPLRILPVTFPMPLLAAFLLIALPWLNPFASGPTPAVEPLLFSWACAVVLLVVVRVGSGRTARDAWGRVIAAAWLLAALLSAWMGLLQYFGASAGLGDWVNSTHLGEAYANLRQRNQFATLINIGLVALLWWVAQSRAAPDWRPAAGMAAAVLLGLGNAASSSRTGLVQLGLIAVLVLMWTRRGAGWRQPAIRRVLLVTGLTYGVAALALPILAGVDPNASGILSRLHDGGPGCASRLILWRNVIHLIGQHPWLGWGWGELDFAHFITLYPGPRFCEILDNAHNLPLHLAVELGIPVALLVCGGGLWCVWRAQPWRETDATRQLAWGVLAVILLHSLLEYPLWYGPFQMALGLSVWLLWRRPGPALAVSGAFRPPALVLPAGLALISIAILAYVARDYHRISQIYRAPAQRSAAYRDNTLEKISQVRFFQDQVRFAELTTTPLSPANAAHLHDLAVDLLHFSPEPRVAELLIESAVMLGRDEEARFYLQRYKAAFPDNHARWVARQGRR